MTARKLAAVTLAATALLGLAACKSSTSGTGTSTGGIGTATTITQAAAPTATASGPTLAQAQQTYLADLAPFNAAVTKYKALSDPTLPQLKSACAGLASASDSFARQLTVQQWPDAVKAQIAAMVTGATQERVAFQTCSTAPDDATAIAALSSPSLPGATAASEAARIALGLPSN